jgi:hypothetical protein
VSCKAWCTLYLECSFGPQAPVAPAPAFEQMRMGMSKATAIASA